MHKSKCKFLLDFSFLQLHFLWYDYINFSFFLQRERMREKNRLEAQERQAKFKTTSPTT